MTDRLVEQALMLTFDEANIAHLKDSQRQIYRGMYHALHHEDVRSMLQHIAGENGILARRAINNYIKTYIKLMGGGTGGPKNTSSAEDVSKTHSSEK